MEAQQEALKVFKRSSRSEQVVDLERELQEWQIIKQDLDPPLPQSR